MSGGGDLTAGPLWRRTLWFGLPISIALAAHGLLNLVDLVIIGRLPGGAIAAVQVPGAIVMVPMVLFDGICTMVVALIAQARGARRPGDVQHIAFEAITIAIVASVVTAALTPLAVTAMRDHFDLGDPQSMHDSLAYLEIMMYGACTMFWILAATAVLRGVGNSSWPMAILVGSNVLNLLLNLGLVFGNWGFPRLGVAGSAWATVIARGVGAVVGFGVLWRGAGGLRLAGQTWRWTIPHWRTLILAALPSSWQLCIRIFSGIVLLKIVLDAGHGDRTALFDGVGIAIRLEMIAVFVMFGWGSAATAVVGQNLGAGLADRAAQGAWWSTAFAAAISSLIAIVLWVFRGPILRLVMPELPPSGATIATDYLRVTLPSYAVLAVGPVLSRALNGATSTKTPLIIDFLCYVCILCPVAAWASGAGLGDWLKGRPVDVNAAWPVLVGVHVLAAVVYGTVFARGRWKKKGLAVAGHALGGG